MKKNKLQKFADNLTFPNLFQYPFLHREDCPMRGKWHSDYFMNSLPIVIEIGCGKGEYTTGLSERYPDKNFIGIDIKGARLWKGAKYACENSLLRVAFIRARIDFIQKIFAQGEVSEIWITFPDPQHSRERKRLTSPMFLERYRHILANGDGGYGGSNSDGSSNSCNNGGNNNIGYGSGGSSGSDGGGGKIHLKTDDTILYLYTLDDIVIGGGLPLYIYSDDIYADNRPELEDVRAVKTFYEQIWLQMNKKIKYLCFGLDPCKFDSQYPLPKP
ncbi:MAG: tRNA (guanosine(46)-N7)-methyltransferase TrmB [Bacteroidales bacterium]|nr:tRNA (guanosine(46)-N7)-methyltransferase TrmB [Bacteroidales bacterium]